MLLIHYFYTCRYETFNSILRAQNLFGNRQAPNKDIAQNFATMQYLHHIASGGHYADVGGASITRLSASII